MRLRSALWAWCQVTGDRSGVASTTFARAAMIPFEVGPPNGSERMLPRVPGYKLYAPTGVSRIGGSWAIGPIATQGVNPDHTRHLRAVRQNYTPANPRGTRHASQWKLAGNSGCITHRGIAHDTLLRVVYFCLHPTHAWAGGTGTQTDGSDGRAQTKREQSRNRRQ